MKNIKSMLILVFLVSASTNLCAGRWVNWNTVVTDVSNGIHAVVDYVKDSVFNEATSVTGTNVTTTKTVAITGVDSVAVSGVGLVIITQDSTQPEELIIESDEAVMPYIETQVVDNKLSIRIQDNISIKTKTQNIYRIRVKDLVKIDASGAMSIEMANLNTETLTLDFHGTSKIIGNVSLKELAVYATGACNIKLSGVATEQNVKISGISIFAGENLQGKNAIVNGKGSVQLICNVSETITGRISGTSSLSYSGNPIVNVKTSGVASIVEPQS